MHQNHFASKIRTSIIIKELLYHEGHVTFVSVRLGLGESSFPVSRVCKKNGKSVGRDFLPPNFIVHKLECTGETIFLYFFFKYEKKVPVGPF